MDTLMSWDAAAFRWINRDLANPVFDVLMPFLSGNRYFVPATVVLAVLLLWKGGRRGIVFVLVLGACLGLANELLVEPLKAWVQRPRPFVALPDTILRVGRGSPYASMPSGHALLAGVTGSVVFWYYRRVAWVVVPVVAGVALSRVYNGVHFPGDIAVGFGLGIGFSAAFLWAAERAWRRAAPRWMPALARQAGSLLHPDERAPASPAANPPRSS